jgi:hypothetical protein
MGVLIGGFFIPLVRSGKLRQLLQAAELGRTESNRQTNLEKVCEINVSVSNDYERARIFPKRYVAHMLLVLDALGFSDAEFRALHIDPEAVKKIKAAFTAGGSIEDVAPMITDAMNGGCRFHRRQPAGLYRKASRDVFVRASLRL